MSRTLSGINADSGFISIPKVPEAIRIGGELGPRGFLVGVSNTTGNVDWVQATTPFIPPNTITGEDLTTTIGFETTASENGGVIRVHNEELTGTLECDKLATSDIVLTGDLELEQMIIKDKIIFATDGTGANRTLQMNSSSGDIIQYETYDPSSEYASIKNGAGAFRSLNTSGSIVSAEARGGPTDLAISALGNVQFGGYMNCRAVQTTLGAVGQFTGSFLYGLDIPNPVGGSDASIKLLALRCQGDVSIKSPANETDIVLEINHLDNTGSIDQTFKIVNSDITLVRNITASGTITGAFIHIGTAIFNPSATSTETCIVFEIQTETSALARPSVNCNYDFFIYHTPTGDCNGTIEKVKIDTTDGDNTHSLFHGLLEIKDDDITPENIVYSFDANNQTCFLEGQITLKPTIRASPLASDEVVIQKGGANHIVFNVGDNPIGVNTDDGYSEFMGSMYFSTLTEDTGVGATLSNAICFGGTKSTIQTTIPIIIKDLDKDDNTGGIIFQTADPAIRGYTSTHTKCFNLDLSDSSNAIPTIATEAHESLTRFQPEDEYVFPDNSFPDASHYWYNWHFGGPSEGATLLHSQFYAQTGSLEVLNHRVGFSVYVENMLMGDLSGESYNRDLFAHFTWTSSVDAHVVVHTTDTHYIVSGGEFISELDAVHQFGQERRNGTMLNFEDYITFPATGYVYKVYPHLSNYPLNSVEDDERAFIQLSAGTTGGGELYPSWWVWANPVPTNFRNYTGLS